MAVYDPHDTLAFHNSRVFCSHRDMSSVPTQMVALAMRGYLETHDTTGTYAVPETCAIAFYAMNHLIAEIAGRYSKYEPLPEFEREVVNHYQNLMSAIAVRSFYYLLLICTREARHNKSLSTDAEALQGQFGSAVHDFFVNIKGGEGIIHKKLMNTPPDVDIGTYCKSLAWQFYNCKWSPGYGGKAWGAVTDCLVRFVDGTYSAEMMVDTIWTLSHNNGPIFNKGMLFSNYHPQYIIRILDVQRAGQIPTMILHDNLVSEYVPSSFRQLIESAHSKYPSLAGPYIDWFAVEDLGSVNKYHTEKLHQKAKWGIPEGHAAKHNLMLKKKGEAALLAKQKEEALAKEMFTVLPGLTFKKVVRS